MKKLFLALFTLAITHVAIADTTKPILPISPVLLAAHFSIGQVTHSLYPINATNAPHPFYKKQCAKKKTLNPYSHANGSAIVWFNPKTNVMKFAITYSGLSGSPIMAHFHLGKAGVSGPIIQTICGRPPKNNKALGYSSKATSGHACPKGESGFLSGTYVLKGNPHIHLTAEQEKQALLNSEIYINIHTCLNELGELRAQIVSPLSPAQ